MRIRSQEVITAYNIYPLEVIKTKQTLTGQQVPIGIILHNSPVVIRERDNFSRHASTENKLMSKTKKKKTSLSKGNG